ncbi:hypothetical protein BABINDRAFT_34298 [Babjeviella inositovora NRRL Y-12698]|uniref:RNB domain-containing protein n=1 Tax=Babjeviella inositovora NRRL Y-12698 TaxID=984486 RepID=A0A1E3QUZ9_9ASCO|nr:uncharacterized protein BABINDRAFT_34298 [Babjeviella inositovora NRRL Y-12698]ODQ81394.1 hypothetical protein BABINDRAFT_34298 [Babjeviella inositovora NRRL Y-12698]
MLPRKFTKLAGLGTSTKPASSHPFSKAYNPPSRCITYSFKINPNHTNAQILQHFSDNTDFFSVRPGLIKNFPKVSYNYVNHVITNTIFGDIASSSLIQQQRDFRDLLRVASLLRKLRVSNGAIITGGGESTLLEVAEIDLMNVDYDDESMFEAFARKHEKPSQIIVNELMTMANHISGLFFQRNGIPGIYRNYKFPKQRIAPGELTCWETLNRRCVESVANSQIPYPGLNSLTGLGEFLAELFYSVTPDVPGHDMLGLSCYLPSTSPLRHFADLVNHWQLQRWFRGESFFFDEQKLLHVVTVLQPREKVLVEAISQSRRYLLHKRLQRLGMNMEHTCVVTCPPYPKVTNVDYSLVRVLMLPYGIRCWLKYDQNRFPVAPRIGQYVKCKVAELDLIEGELVVGMVKKKAISRSTRPKSKARRKKSENRSLVSYNYE